MSNETEASIADNKNDMQDDEWISKSQLKRESEALKQLGKKLCSLNDEHLARIPLDDKLQDAIALAHKLSNKRGALKRHYQFIGKLLRATDAEPILKAVDDIEHSHSRTVQAFKSMENWRDRILEEGDAAIQEFCEKHEQAERQNLRQLYRNYQQAKDEKQQTRFARLLFKMLRDNSST